MKVTLDQIYANDDFMFFWNSVYGDLDIQISIKNTFMEFAYMGWLAGINHEKEDRRYFN
jgi:hypothetical protein